MKANRFLRSLASFGLVVGATIVVYTGAASAADKAPPYREQLCEQGRYTGFYVGANGGYLDNMARRTDSDALLGEAASLVADKGSLTGGGGAGYDWQFHCTVFGIEADLQWAGADANGMMTPNAPAVMTFSSKMQWFSTVRARAGIAVDQALLYGTAGLALAGVKDTWTVGVPALAPPFVASWTDNRVGLAVGGGIEYAWSGNISLKAEALYLAFSDLTRTISVPAALALNPCNCAQIRGANSALVARAGVNFKLGGL